MNDEVKDVILSVFEASLDALTPRGPSPPSGRAHLLPSRVAVKVCLKWTWPSTYSKRPAPRCMSPRSWTASKPTSA